MYSALLQEPQSYPLLYTNISKTLQCQTFTTFSIHLITFHRTNGGRWVGPSCWDNFQSRSVLQIWIIVELGSALLAACVGWWLFSLVPLSVYLPLSGHIDKILSQRAVNSKRINQPLYKRISFHLLPLV